MRKLPKIISQEEFEKLFESALQKEKKAKSKSRMLTIKQYRVAMLLGFEAGMRISEIVGYKDKVPKLTQAQVEPSHIRILSGKGEKDRVVPRPKRFNQTAKELLPLTIKRRSLQDFITKLGRTVLNKEITFHTLRHGFSTHYYNKTKDIRGLQLLLGHSRIDTTAIYMNVNPEDALNKARDVF
jgi:integrase/recombinase XerD